MKPERSRRGCWTWLAIMVVMFGLPVFLAWNFLLGPMLEFQSRFNSLKGQPKSEVLAEVGPPKYTLTKAQVDASGIDYPWRPLNLKPVPSRGVTKEVLLYHAFDRGAYVFIGWDDRVEAVEFASAAGQEQ